MRRAGERVRRRATRALLGSLAAALLALMAVSACEDEPAPTPDPACPNKLPEPGDSCVPGLQCSYADTTGCAPPAAPYFYAECSAAGTWLLDDPCAGMGGGGGDAGQGGGATVGSGGMGGGGGEGPCVDPQEGPPQVISELTELFPPDATEGFYRLQFSEDVMDVASHVSWSGPGQLDAVTKAGAAYNVYFSGLAPGDSATLTVQGVPDSCGTAMVEPVDVTLNIRNSCHYLTEAFEGGVPAGWSVQDNGSSGHLWAHSTAVGAPNHTSGGGSCATTNDSAAGAGSWDTELRSPVIDLTNAEDVVIKYRSDFKDTLGAGDAWLEASVDGNSWTVLSHWSADRGPSDEAVDLAPFVGGPVQLRWRYTNGSATGSWWDIDDVCMEEFTKVVCPCPAGGYNELTDIVGMTNGNGTLGMAENTLSVLSMIGERVTMCGYVEADGLMSSGADFFGFTMNSGMPAGAVDATVTYCVENAFQNATTDVWVKTSGVPLLSLPATSKQGSYDVQLVDGEDHYLSITPGSDDYNLARYSFSIEVKNIPTPLITEDFEVWPPSGLTITNDDPCLDWGQSNMTVVPPGTLPPQGQNLAYFNSYDCPMGTESLESAPLNLVGMTTAMLSFDMFHDTGYANSLDEIQVEYNLTGTWIPIGLPFVRPGPVEMWENHVLDLSALAGQPSVRVRLKATTAYGNNIHIDNVIMVAN